MSISWMLAVTAAAGLILTLAVHAVSLSFRIGEQARDVANIKRMLGLSNGTEPLFIRADMAERRFVELADKVDHLTAEIVRTSTSSAQDRAQLHAELVEIKLLLAGRA